MNKVYGKTPTGGRQEYDYYATEPIAVKLLLNQEKFDCNIWECASGETHIADVLKGYGYNVRTSDIVKRTPTTEVKDFLKSRRKWDGDIITNPPFKYALEFIDKALSLVGEGHKVAMFLRLQFLEGIGRYENLFKDNPPKTVYVASRRIKCGKDGDFNSSMSSIMCLAWFVWEKGFKGNTVIKWINHDEELDESRMRATQKVAKKAKGKATRARIICFWNKSATDAVSIVRGLYSHRTDFVDKAIEIGIAGGKVASTTPTMSQSASINGLQSYLCLPLIVPMSTVGWNVGMYEMPQCSARGTPIL